MRVVLFANGALPEPEHVHQHLRIGDLILCADGGTRHALALGLRPDRVVGDLDSMGDGHQVALEALHTAFERHPVDKDATDLELALLAAKRLGANEVLVLGALGGRLDQELANLLLLTSPQFADLQVSLASGSQTAWIVRSRIEVQGQIGDIVSTLALSPQVEGLTYHSGLRWPLREFTLSSGSTRGISNEMTAERAVISLNAGVLLVIHIPGSAVARISAGSTDEARRFEDAK